MCGHQTHGLGRPPSNESKLPAGSFAPLAGSLRKAERSPVGRPRRASAARRRGTQQVQQASYPAGGRGRDARGPGRGGRAQHRRGRGALPAPRRLRGALRRRRRGGPRAAGTGDARPRRARPHAAQGRRLRGHAPAAGARRHAHHHADGAQVGGRAHRRARDGRRRLRGEALQRPGAGQPRARRAAARRRPARRVAWRRRWSSTASPSTRCHAPSRCAARSATSRRRSSTSWPRWHGARAQVFNREKLLELVWGSAEYIDPSTVTVHVRRVREKIEEDPSQPRFIATVWGVGYRFEP